MTQPETEDVTDVHFQTILDFTLPFFLVGAAGNQALGSAAILELIDAYTAASARELYLVGRLICLGIAAMDNLRRSMQPDLSDTKILGYRSNAIHLSRSSDRYQTMLDALQAAPRISTNLRAPPIAAPAPTPSAPAPTPVVPAPTPVVIATDEPHVAQAVSSKSQTTQPKTQPPQPTGLRWLGADLEKMPHEARMFIEAMQARGGAPSAVAQIPFVDPVAASKAATRAALAAAGVPGVHSTG